MNWTEELFTSLLWIVKSLFIASLVFSLILYFLIKMTRWGHQFWLLAKSYLSPRHSLMPLCYFWVIVFFDLLSVRLDILFSSWYKSMYDALQEMNVVGF